MRYKTNYQIIDVKDKNRYYKKGAKYPYENAKVADERIKELLDKGHISEVEGYKEPTLNDYTVKELKEIAQEKGLEGYSDLKKDELIQLLEQEWFYEQWEWQ